MISHRSKNERKKKKKRRRGGGTVNTPDLSSIKKKVALFDTHGYLNFMRRYHTEASVIQRNSRLMSFNLLPPSLSHSLSFTVYQDADPETASRQAAVNKEGWYDPSAIRCLKLIVPLSGLSNNFRARSNGEREGGKQPDYGNGISLRDINTFDTVPLYIRLIRRGKNFSTPLSLSPTSNPA